MSIFYNSFLDTSISISLFSRLVTQKNNTFHKCRSCTFSPDVSRRNVWNRTTEINKSDVNVFKISFLTSGRSHMPLNAVPNDLLLLFFKKRWMIWIRFPRLESCHIRLTNSMEFTLTSSYKTIKYCIYLTHKSCTHATDFKERDKDRERQRQKDREVFAFKQLL